VVWPRDKSPKGSVDAPIASLVAQANRLPFFYTTSSCSGRITLFQNARGRRKGGEWLLVEHAPVDWEEVWRVLERHVAEHKGTVSAGVVEREKEEEKEEDVVFRQEPFILHRECRSLQQVP